MKITLNPIKEIYINQIVKSDIQRITKQQAINDKSLSWCKGYLFSIDVIQNDELIKKQSEGFLYLDTFVYAESEKIDVSKWNGYSIEVIDFTGFEIIESLIGSIVNNEVL